MLSYEYKIIRSYQLIKSNDENKKIEGFVNSIDISNNNGWFVMTLRLLDDLNNYLSIKDIVLNKIALLNIDINNIINNRNNLNNEIMNLDSYFNNLEKSSSIKQEVLKIKENSNKYYDKGDFSNFISAFNKYIIPIKKEIQDNEMHSFIIKYAVSCIIKNQYDIAISEISRLKNDFHKYDINVYIL